MPDDHPSDPGAPDNSRIDLQAASPSQPPLPVLVGVVQDQPEQQVGYVYSEPPKRHGCLTSFLVFALCSHIYVIALYVLTFRALLFHDEAVHGRTVPPLFAAMFIVIAVCNIVFINALFKWRRWGLYGNLTAAVVTLLLNLIAGINPIVSVVLGVFGVSLMLWVLSIGGKRRSAWRYLK